MNTQKTLIGIKVKFTSVPAPYYNDFTEKQEFFTEIEELNGVICEEFQDNIVSIKTDDGDIYITGEYDII